MQTINDRYTFDPKTDLLGRGGFGRVFKAQDTLLDREVVLKMAEKSDLPDKYSLVQEISRVIELSHPNLVRYYDAIVMQSFNEFGEQVEHQIGVMEYVSGGDLRGFMEKHPSPSTLKEVVKGILEGLAYLHENGLIHRDIKPANVLLQPKKGVLVAKICDFGISKVAGSEATALSNVIGTYEYMSPEQLGELPDQMIDTRSDLWSLGVMLYELCTGELPFGSRKAGVTDARIIGNIISPGIQIPEKITTIEEPYQSIIKACLVKDANVRAKGAEVLLELFEEPKSEKPIVSVAQVAVPPGPVVPPKVLEQSKQQSTQPVQQPDTAAEKSFLAKNIAWIVPVAALPFLVWLGISVLGNDPGTDDSYDDYAEEVTTYPEQVQHFAYITGDDVNVRRDPEVRSGNVITQLDKNQRVEVLDTEFSKGNSTTLICKRATIFYSLHRDEVPFNKGKAVSLIRQKPNGAMYVNADLGNGRFEEGYMNPFDLELDGATIWYQVQTNAGRGWVHGDYVQSE